MGGGGGLHPASIEGPVSWQICDWGDTGSRCFGESASVIVEVETVRSTAILGAIASAYHVAVGSRSGGASSFNGRAAPTFVRVFGTSKVVTGVITGRSTRLDRVIRNRDLIRKRPSTVIVAGGKG